MALIFTEGFDAYGTTTGSFQSPSGVISRRGWINIVNPIVRTGRINGQSMSIGNTNFEARMPLGNTETTKTVGIAFQLQATTSWGQPMLTTFDGTTFGMNVHLNSSGILEVRRGTTVLATHTEVIAIGEWHYLEFKTTINNTTGSYDLKLNGTSILSGSSVDTQIGSNTYFDGFGFKNTGFGSQHTVYFDDLFITDSTGTSNTGFLGSVHIETFFPDSDVTSQWATSSGTDHFAMVDDNPADDDTTYLEDNVAAQRELFDFPALAIGSGTVFGVTSIVDLKVTDASSVDMKFVNVSGTTTTLGAANTITSTSASRVEEILEQNPDTSSAWTKTSLEAAQFGFEIA